MYNTLLEVIKSKNISRYKLAKISDINPPDLYSALNGNKVLYPGWKKRISEALGMDIEELFEEGE